MDKKELVYEALNGFLEKEEDYIIDGIEIKNEFEDDSELDKCGKAIYKAKKNLRQILSDSMYEEVEIIDSRFEEMMKEIAYKMFEYGILFGKKE